MADKRAYFKMDVGYLTNPKVADVAIESPTAVLLHIGSIAYSAQHLTDGVVPVNLLLRLTGSTKKDAQQLYNSGLWRDLGNGSAEIHDYLEHQRSSEEVKAASEKAMRAADARWNATSNASSNASSMPDAKRVASESSMPRERGEREERDTSGKARKRATHAPDIFAVTDEMRTKARQKYPLADVDRETEKFLDHHRAKGNTFKDWNAAWRTWMANAQVYAERDGRTARPQSSPAATSFWDKGVPQ